MSHVTGWRIRPAAYSMGAPLTTAFKSPSVIQGQTRRLMVMEAANCCITSSFSMPQKPFPHS